MLGRKVTTLVDKTVDAGGYVVAIDRQYSNGLYMVRLTAAGENRVARLVAVRK